MQDKLIKRQVILIGMVMLQWVSAWAITQQGYVRTISRPNRSSERLQGVLIRVKGGHNTILSTETGDFAILLQELHNGDPYALSAVMKGGYQLAEQEMIGRQQAGSERVPLEVTMVSLAQLQEEKNAIAAKARAGVEKYYMERIQAIEQELSAQRLTTEQYEQQLAALDDKLMQSEQQIEQMADRYARTDYALLDSVAGAIQQAIEQGDLDQAEQLIKQKGTLRDRQQRVADLQRAAAAQLQDLKQDYYHLHSIALSRFEPDSAALYLKQRADLDTTDAATQLDYAKYLNEYLRDREEAYRYVLRAERQLLQRGEKESMLMLLVMNERGQYLYHAQQYVAAEETYQQAIALSTELNGAEHSITATRRINLGSIYYATGKIKEARKQLEEAVRIYHLPGQEDAVSEANALNGLGGIAFAEKKYEQARSYFEQSVAVLRKASPNNNTLPQTLGNLAAICTYTKDTDAASRYYQEAYEAAKRILGERNAFTQKMKKIQVH